MRTFWRITKLLGDYKRLTVAGFALAFAQMGLSLLVPRVTQLAIDRALLGGDSHMLVWYGLGLIGVGAVRFAVGVGRRLTTGKASLGIEYDLRQRLWSHLLRQPFAYFDRWPTGQLMSRLMSDITNVRMFLGYGMVFFAVNVVMILAIAVILLALDWRLALLSLAFLPALLLVRRDLVLQLLEEGDEKSRSCRSLDPRPEARSTWRQSERGSVPLRISDS